MDIEFRPGEKVWYLSTCVPPFIKTGVFDGFGQSATQIKIRCNEGGRDTLPAHSVFPNESMAVAMLIEVCKIQCKQLKSQQYSIESRIQSCQESIKKNQAIYAKLCALETEED